MITLFECATSKWSVVKWPKESGSARRRLFSTHISDRLGIRSPMLYAWKATSEDFTKLQVECPFKPVITTAATAATTREAMKIALNIPHKRQPLYKPVAIQGATITTTTFNHSISLFHHTLCTVHTLRVERKPLKQKRNSSKRQSRSLTLGSSRRRFALRRSMISVVKQVKLSGKYSIKFCSKCKSRRPVM